ncbi:hypothetical protein [Paenibacillus sp.]|uniref:hypothetical protein n=1 Tax=Paenibacillus sp. TaxID=58172 RepID=UPI002D3348D1|nr:hypothetical protein [Paenibacillus sp.]HZG55896.1 hypothetical protein [Paenibacillus sp.]
MRRWIAGYAAAALTATTLFSFPAGASPVVGEPTQEPSAVQETEAVTDGGSPFVQQGLTIYELDKELLRLQAEEADVDASIEEQRQQIARQQVALDQRTASAGRVLRSYYMGQRDRMWLLLFRMSSLSEALTVLDYLQAIVTNDFRTLELYREAYRERQSLLAELTSRQARLDFVIAEHERQRVRLLEEQAELDRRLAELDEAEREAQLAAIAAATTEWEEEGIPLFEEVLSALGAAMTDLPALLSDPELISVKGGSMEIRLTEDAFNAFLMERNPIFETFRFGFAPSGLTVTGAYEEKTATLQGAYILEKEPANALRFQIDSVRFNGYELPEPTRAAMQDRYDLSFEPGRLVAGLEVSELINEQGVLRVKLRFAIGASRQ